MKWHPHRQRNSWKPYYRPLLEEISRDNHTNPYKPHTTQAHSVSYQTHRITYLSALRRHHSRLYPWLHPYILDLPHYDLPRHKLRRDLGQKEGEIPYLLGENKVIKAFLRCIHATRRFKWYFGPLFPASCAAATFLASPSSTKRDRVALPYGSLR